MNKILFFILILGAAIWWFQPGLIESKIPEIPSFQAQTPMTKLTRHPAGTSMRAVVPKKGPYFVLRYLNDFSFVVVPGDAGFYELESFLDQKVEIALMNSQDYDSIQMWGADTQSQLPGSIVFDWTQKELTNSTFDLSFFKQKKIYRMQWNNVLTKESRRTNFAFSEEKAVSPTFRVTYQPLDTGTKVVDLTYTRDQLEMTSARLPKLQLRKNSMIGFKFEFATHKLITCEYQPPHGQTQDCSGWAQSDYIGSVGSQDVGWHRIQLSTDKGPYSFEVEISQIH